MKPKERPILFSAPMVRAILSGSKTVTRRAVKPVPQIIIEDRQGRWPALLNDVPLPCPFGAPGARLWVRETWRADEYRPAETIYRADGPVEAADCVKWKPSIFMPRARSRITLIVTSVRAQRLHEITRDSALAEGIDWKTCGPVRAYRDYLDSAERTGEYNFPTSDPIASFRSLWASINGPDSWDSNPWVWVIAFSHTVKEPPCL